MKKAERIVFQARMTEEQVKQFRAIAVYHGMPMSMMLKQWIRRAYKALPEEAR